MYVYTYLYIHENVYTLHEKFFTRYNYQVYKFMHLYFFVYPYIDNLYILFAINRRSMIFLSIHMFRFKHSLSRI